MNLLAENSSTGLLVTLLVCGALVGVMIWISNKKKPDPRRGVRKTNGNGNALSGKKATGAVGESTSTK